MNKVILIGRLTKDPELRKTPTDVSVCRFTIAVNRDYTPQGQERQADFISCVAWRNQAENLARYIRKGGLIAVDGSIQTGSYDDANGVRKFTTDVVANQITFLESKKSTGNGYDDMSQVPPMSNNSNNFGNGYNNNYNNNNYNNGYNNNYNNNYQNTNTNNNNYNNNQNQNNGYSQESPFGDVKSNFDISSDDLPF